MRGVVVANDKIISRVTILQYIVRTYEKSHGKNMFPYHPVKQVKQSVNISKMKLPSKNYKTVFSFAILLYLLFIFVLFININNLQLRSQQLDEHIQVKTDYSVQIHEINPGLIANNIVRDNKDKILLARYVHFYA